MQNVGKDVGKALCAPREARSLMQNVGKDVGKALGTPREAKSAMQNVGKGVAPLLSGDDNDYYFPLFPPKVN